MMKKTYKSSLLALSVLASFTSCSESESLQQANLSKDKITFHATLDNSWKPLSPASSSRAAIAAATEKGPIVVPTPFGKPLYLHSVVQETADLQQAAATTRGVMQEGTTLGNTYYNNSFGVTAISKNNGTNTALFTNQKASKNNEDIWEIEDKTNSRWPFDALVSFHAYAPFNDATDGMWSVTTDAENVKTKIKYTAKSGETEIPSQPDIIVATNAESRSVSSDDKAVELKFSHALTAVNFAISKDLTDIFKTGATDGSKLKSITLSGIPNEGTCELTATEGAPQTPSQKWTFDTESDGAKKTGTYIFDLTKKDIQIGESYALTSNEDKNILMMIPQNLQGTNAQLTFVLDIKGKGEQTFTFDLSNQTWLPGTSVTYKLSASAVDHLENAEVKFPDSWKDTEQVKYSYPKTDFAAGESIGLYVVNSKNIIEEANVKLTRDQDGKWMPENNNTKFLKLKNYKYFAYYPYSASKTEVAETATTATDFFDAKISSWNLSKEQDTDEKLLAQDLQIAKGVVDGSGGTLTFEMAHAMGLAEITIGLKTFDNIYYLSGYTEYTWKNGTTSFYAYDGISDYSLRKVEDKRYIGIVKPGVTTVFSCSRSEDTDAWDKPVSVTPLANSIGKGTAMTKRVWPSISYTMQIGDIYYDNGGMTRPNTTDIAAARNNGLKTIGVVGYLGNNKWTEAGTGSGFGGHALVMCLKSIGSKNTTDHGTRYKLTTNHTDPPAANTFSSTNGIRNTLNNDYGSGYKTTVQYWENSNTPAIKAVKEYRDGKIEGALPFPKDKSTGWFLPSVGQWYAVLNSLGGGWDYSDNWSNLEALPKNSTQVSTKIHTALSVVGDGNYTFFYRKDIFPGEWTSTRYPSKDRLYHIDSAVDDNMGANTIRFYINSNVNQRYVRPFLAF